MNIKTIKKIILSAVVTLSVTSCGTIGQVGQLGQTDASTAAATTAANSASTTGNAAVNAAVDAATKNNPVAGEAIRQATGFGTSPAEKATSGILGGLGL